MRPNATSAFFEAELPTGRRTNASWWGQRHDALAELRDAAERRARSGEQFLHQAGITQPGARGRRLHRGYPTATMG